MLVGDLYGMKLFSSPLLTKKIDHGIRRRVLPEEIIWERYIEEVPDNNIYFLPDMHTFIGSTLTMDILKKSIGTIIGIGA